MNSRLANKAEVKREAGKEGFILKTFYINQDLSREAEYFIFISSDAKHRIKGHI